MDRVYKSAAAVAAPLAAENASAGYPTAGNPGLGIAATKPGPFWFHMITESMINVLLAAGLAPDKNDLTLFRQAINLLAGASTGDAKPTFKIVADPGWILVNDGTIGNAASGGTTRANADTSALFTLLWTNITNAWAPVSGGRGGTAAADFAANKTLGIPKALGRAMAIAGTGATLTARALGESLGTEAHTLTLAQMAAHAHGVAGLINGVVGGASIFAGNSPSTLGESLGGGGSHPNMQPSWFMNFMIKL